MPPSTEDQPTLINEISTLEMSKQAFSREYFAHRSNRYELHETSHDVVVSGSDSGYRLIFADKTFAKHHKNTKFAKVFSHEIIAIWYKD